MSDATPAQEEAPFRAVDDIGLRHPLGMGAVEPELEAVVMRLAGLTRGAGIILAAREIAADPSGTLRTVLSLLKLLIFGRAQQMIDEVAANAPRLDCKSGCSWCCYQSVEATIPEAILVAAQLTDPADPRRSRLRANAAAFRSLSERDRRRTGTACAFLVDNRCSVYEARPLMCRAMMAADSASCRAHHAAGIAGEADVVTETFPYVQYFLLGDQAGLRGILRDMGLQDDPVELTQAVAAIIDDPAIVGRWLAGERAFTLEMATPPDREKAAAQRHAAAPAVSQKPPKRGVGTEP